MKQTPKRTPRKTSTSVSSRIDAAASIGRFTRQDPALQDLVDAAALNAEAAQLIYDARTAAGLTQRELAERIGSTQSVVARLEDADYGGHSLSLLQRIAAALGLRLRLQLVPSGTVSPAPRPRSIATPPSPRRRKSPKKAS